MDYLVEITNLIRLAKHRQIHYPLVDYKEKHHIIPRSIGKLLKYNERFINRKDNIVHLTAAEHFKIHVWLYEWFKKYYGMGHTYTIKMIQALNRLLICKPSKNTPNINVTPEEYEYYRIQHSNNLKEGYKSGTLKHPTKGKKYTEEQRKQMSIAKAQYYKENTHPSLGCKRADKCKQKMKHAWINRRKNGFVNPNKGIIFSTQRLIQHAEIREKWVYEILDPNNNIIICKNLTKFCQTVNLDKSSMTRTFYKNHKKSQNHHKGYKIIMIYDIIKTESNT